MQTSKMKKIMRYLMPLLILLFFSVGEHMLGRLVTPLNSAVYFRDEIAELKASGKEADILFLGTSRVYHSFVPEVFEEKLGMDLVINGGTATQRPESSYLFLKDMDRSLKPKMVVLGVQWSSLLEDATKAQTMESTLMVYDRESAAGRAEMLFAKAGSDIWCELLPLYRYRNDLRFDTMKEIAEKWDKYKTEGRNPDTTKDQYYHGKGFIYANHHCETGNIPIMDEGAHVFSEEMILEKNLKCLDKITAYCKKNDIKLMIICPPMSVMNLYHVEGYQDAVSYYASYCEKNGIIFHNLNYMKGREEWLPDDMMTDYVHLNGEGAYRMSERFAEILEKDLKGGDTSSYFYADLDELKKDIHRVVALKTKRYTENGRYVVQAAALYNEDETPVYRAEVMTEDGEYVCVADWTEQERLEFIMPEGSRKIKVYAALSPDDPDPAWQEYELEE